MRALAALFSLAPGAAEAACRLALVLALDVSGSVDGREYRLQIDGIARALDAPAVRDAILAFPDAPVAITVFEWSMTGYQREVLDWTSLDGPAAIDAVTAKLRAWERIPAPEATGIGWALEHGASRIRNGPDCWRRVIDISGDGKNNSWPLPRDVRASGRLDGITVNALVVGVVPRIGDERQADIAELAAYFRTRVIHGPGAFIQAALGFEAYAEAMELKLLREISAPPLGWHRPAQVRRLAARR